MSSWYVKTMVLVLCFPSSDSTISSSLCVWHTSFPTFWCQHMERPSVVMIMIMVETATNPKGDQSNMQWAE